MVCLEGLLPLKLRNNKPQTFPVSSFFSAFTASVLHFASRIKEKPTTLFLFILYCIMIILYHNK